jgi:membrane associated rhomboid family serine protease
MLADRDYMRSDPSGGSHRKRPWGSWSATTWLIVLNAGVFLVQAIFYGYPPDFRQGPPLALQVDELLRGYVWQLLTYQFLHGGLLHILLNCWGIFAFGRDVEEALGKRTFLLLYFISGMVGGVLQVLASLGWQGHFGGAVVGASAGLFGIIAAFAMMYPNRSLTLLLFFVIPVTLRAKTLLLVSGAIAIFGILFPGDHIAHAAHLGGMLAGMVFIRQMRDQLGYWPGETSAPRPPGRPSWFGVGPAKPPKSGVPPVIDVEEAGGDDYMAREVDPILEKISAQGIHSLTARERKILEEARKRMGRK